MSVGHVARAVESAGIPTVVAMVRAFRHHAVNMKIPRAVLARHPMGRPLGAPGDAERQRAVVRAALDLLETAAEGPALVELEPRYRLPASPRRA